MLLYTVLFFAWIALAFGVAYVWGTLCELSESRPIEVRASSQESHPKKSIG